MNQYRYFNNCVNWNQSDVHNEGGLCDLIKQKVSISRRTFLERVNRDDLRMLEEQLSYSQHPSRGLTMAGDWHINYFRSRHHGELVYGFDHSRIEYVFKVDTN